jgi:hypothetical protein
MSVTERNNLSASSARCAGERAARPRAARRRISSASAPASTSPLRPMSGYIPERGMSVTPDDPAWLPPHVRPRWLGGVGKLPVFSLDFAVIGAPLRVRLDPNHPDRHAFVEPASMMTVDEYQAALCSTRALVSEVSE